jgi:N-acetylglucosaminyl-diphospho-decaprenol L-rhamnosyltransferase
VIAREGAVTFKEMAFPVDVVVVSFNSRNQLRGCVEPLLGIEGVRITVVDNASPDGSLEAVEGLPVDSVQLERNGGFAHGCNVGWRAGEAKFVLFLNPDARIDAQSLRILCDVLERESAVGVVAPRILHADGTLDFSQRRFPRLRSTYAQALFLHRLFPRAAWTDELDRRPEVYASAQAADWVSGACFLMPRSLLEELGGLDEEFFLYCEDTDLCRRVWDAGYEVRYEPSAVVLHEGGASAPRPSLLPILAASRLRYAAKHGSKTTAGLERVGVGLGALTHALISRGGRQARGGHVRALRIVASRSAPRGPSAAPG